MLERWRARLLGLERDAPLRFHAVEDYDERLRLKPGVAPLTPVQSPRR